MPKAIADHATGTQRGSGSAPSLKLEEFLPYRLNVLANLVSQALYRIYSSRYEIGIAEWRVIATLGQYGIMTGKAVGDHTQMHKTKVSRAVAVLTQREWIAREANPSDLRESFLSLTPAGRAVYEELAPVAQNFARELLDVVPPADRAALDRSLSRLTEHTTKLATPENRG
jgi:DNA-binding MarR family transcriptional regulator